MKIAAKQEDGSQSIEHGTQFLLIDKQGRVRGIYRGQSTDPQEMQRLATDAQKLAGEKSP
jgi:cytochrome oxidase Cu insertion factor (SCO1/SenC/PrrC family)